MSQKHGVNSHGPILECMVVGCSRKALYKGVAHSTQRGYCARHKHLAVTKDRQRLDDRLTDYMMNTKHQEWKD